MANSTSLKVQQLERNVIEEQIHLHVLDEDKKKLEAADDLEESSKNARLIEISKEKMKHMEEIKRLQKEIADFKGKTQHQKLMYKASSAMSRQGNHPSIAVKVLIWSKCYNEPKEKTFLT
jgi:septal ring factor EnvC (AmiA/AmiB activator)